MSRQRFLVSVSNSFCKAIEMNSTDPIFGPLQFVLDCDSDCALAIIIRTSGPSYRSVGSVMAVAANGISCGSLSSGCIEADIIGHALGAIADKTGKVLTYGSGSPFIDLRLPCGGAMTVLIEPCPDRSALRRALTEIEGRIPQCVAIGEIKPGSENDSRFFLNLEPQLAFRIFGNGAEVIHFAALAVSLGYETSVYTPDSEAFKKLQSMGIAVQHLKTKDALPSVTLDRWTAAILFFHDHDWEPIILQQMLESDAFYIGAQGSHLARQNRDAALANMGISADKISRIAGPIGLIPSVRDPRSLAVSVLAEVLALAQGRTD